MLSPRGSPAFVSSGKRAGDPPLSLQLIKLKLSANFPRLLIPREGFVAATSLPLSSSSLQFGFTQIYDAVEYGL